MSENYYYNYDRVISYNAFLNFLIISRGVGKTFGASEFVTDQFIKKGDEFVYLRRYKTDLEKGFRKFFSSLIKENKFPEHKLSTKGHTYLIDEKVGGYGMALSTAHQYKSANFPNVKNIVFDEFLIEDGQSHYLKNEVNIFLGLIESIARMRDVRVFLLGNSTSEINPYFLYFNLTLPRNNDIKLFKDGLILLQYLQKNDYIEAKKKTRFGQLVSDTEYEDYAINNKFIDSTNTFIEKKTGTSKFLFSFLYNGNQYGVWVDYNNGKMYISNDFIEGMVFATTTKDHKPNTLFFSVAKNYTCWNMFVENYKLGNVYFESNTIKNASKEILKNIILRRWCYANTTTIL